MKKRELPAEGTQSPPKKRARQTRLDAFFNGFPPKVRTAQTEGSTPSNRRKVGGTKGGTSVLPIIIDDEGQEAAEPVSTRVSQAKVGGNIAQSHVEEAKPLLFAPLDVDPVIYLPDEQPWLRGGAPYAFLAYTLSTISQTRSRIIIINALTNCLRTVMAKQPETLLPSLYLLSNTLAPPYIPVELGLGPSIISRAIQSVSGITPATLKRLYNTLGDPGDVAVAAKSNLRTLVPHPPLTIPYVYESLLKIAHSKGQGATKQKEKIVEKLLLSANGEEVRFLTRTLCQNIRVGAVRVSLLTALARAIVLSRASSDLPKDEDDLQVSSKLLSKIQKLPAEAKKKPTDPARTELNDIFSRAEALVRSVFVKHPNYDDIVSALLETGLAGLDEKVPLAIGIPLHPTLGSPMRSLLEVYERLEDQPFVAEFKYDGQRAQIHATVENGQILDFKMFSRHLEDMTTKYPDIQHLMQYIGGRTPSVTSFIMDAEIVAVDPRTGAIKTFQELANRAKKDVQLKDIQASVCLYAFDLMYLNGKSLLRSTFRERRALLRNHFAPHTAEEIGFARFAHVESIDSEIGRTSVEDFWQKSIESQCEGLMIKLLDNTMVRDEGNSKENASRKKPLPATYEPDKRTAAWLKLKKDYVTGINDSLDLVPVGAWYGNGRKVKWWSPILMALYDQASGRYIAVCKCMSGFTDKFYQALRDRYSPSTEEAATCSVQGLWDCDFGGFTPDVYFRPQEVWEIRGADITLSLVSVAAKGLVSQSRGLSVRFPRFVKVREDKSTEQASTPDFLASMWKKQQGKQAEGDEDLIDADFESSSAFSEGDPSEEDGL